jgi:hypothetical protein
VNRDGVHDRGVPSRMLALACVSVVTQKKMIQITWADMVEFLDGFPRVQTGGRGRNGCTGGTPNEVSQPGWL